VQEQDVLETLERISDQAVLHFETECPLRQREIFAALREDMAKICGLIPEELRYMLVALWSDYMTYRPELIKLQLHPVVEELLLAAESTHVLERTQQELNDAQRRTCPERRSFASADPEPTHTVH
jgi:hypothetical protein